MQGDWRTLVRRGAPVAIACACALAVTGCNQPPALTKTELNAAKLPPKHRKLDPKLASRCRSCHREQKG
jgi:hypothetical protein